MDVALGEWRPIADMHVPRTGLAVCTGPDSCIYAVGGSPDGSRAPHNHIAGFLFKVAKAAYCNA